MGITGDLSRGPTTAAQSGSRVAVIDEDLNIGIHPPPTVGLIIQTVGNQRVAASIWQTDYGDGQADLVDPVSASTLYHQSIGRLLRGAAHEIRASPVDRGRADSKHVDWQGRPQCVGGCMVHRLVLTVGGTGIGGLATRSWPRFPSR